MSRVNVFITVDTEHSIGGAFGNPNLRPVGNEKRVFGKIGDKNYGIPLIMDIADRYGIPLTFFVEVLNKYYFGEEETKKVCHYITERGHDIQLHLHPNYLNFSLPYPSDKKFPDQMFSYSLEQQATLIDEGKKTLMKYDVPAPIAFRAGNFGADRNTLRALVQNGFLIDTSYNRAFLGTSCKLIDFDLADVTLIENVWEFPVTNFLERNFKGNFRSRPLDVNGASFAQMQNAIDQTPNNGPRNITILMHSFSFIHPQDVQYEKAKPRPIVVKRFENLCHYLAKNSHKFRVMTFGDLNSERLSTITGGVGYYFPKVSVIYTIGRNIEQGIDLLLSHRGAVHSKRIKTLSL